LATTRPTLKTAAVKPSTQKETLDRQGTAWMVAAQAGDRTAYETLLRECVPFIKRVARSQGVQADALDDVVQDTLLSVHQARQTYDPSRPFTAWLRAIAQRRAVDGLRRGGRTRTREVYAPLAYENHTDPTGNPEEAVWQVDHAEILGPAIGDLPAKQREAVEHLAVQAQSLEQAAFDTGQSVGALRVNWHRALKALRAQLGAKE
jgi:RNA polymerase sigma-70 factor (ECF subfamily)